MQWWVHGGVVRLHLFGHRVFSIDGVLGGFVRLHLCGGRYPPSLERSFVKTKTARSSRDGVHATPRWAPRAQKSWRVYQAKRRCFLRRGLTLKIVTFCLSFLISWGGWISFHVLLHIILISFCLSVSLPSSNHISIRSHSTLVLGDSRSTTRTWRRCVGASSDCPIHLLIFFYAWGCFLFCFVLLAPWSSKYQGRYCCCVL